MVVTFEKLSSRRIANEMYRISRKFEPAVSRAFMKAVNQIKDRATLKSISDALAGGNLQGAIDVVERARLGDTLKGYGLPPGERTMLDEINDTFRSGATMGMLQLPRQAALAATLDLTNPASVKFLSEHLPTLIREIDATQMAAVRAAVMRGFQEGRSIPMIAREVRNAIGLTETQYLAVSNFRRQLETGAMGAGTAPWDRRLSATEQAQARSLFNAQVPSQDRIDTLVDRYQQSLINKRSLDIARTEVHRASINGQQELWRQAHNDGLIDVNRATRVWIVTPDDRLRPDHAAIPSMNIDGPKYGEPFNTPVGPVMAPGESGIASFDINCRCAEGLRFD